MMHENPHTRSGGEADNRRKSGCKNIDTTVVYADSSQKDGNPDIEWGTHDVGGFQRGSINSASPFGRFP